MIASTRAWGLVRTLPLAVALIGALVLIPGSSAAAGTGGWKQVAPPGVPAGLPPFIQLQCPGLSVCYALASPRNFAWTHPSLDITRDGGATWAVRHLKIDAYEDFRAQPLSCPGVNTCLLLVGTGNVIQPRISVQLTTDGGKTWKDRGPGISCRSTQCDSPVALSCPSATVCYALLWSLNGPAAGGALLITRDAGVHWSTYPLAGAGFPAAEVHPLLACPGVNDCYLSGAQVVRGSGRGGRITPGIAVTHDAGRSWTVRYPGAYLGLSCPTTRQCFAAGDAGRLAVTVDGGKTWKQRSLAVKGVHVVYQPIECPAPGICYAIEPPSPNTPLWSTRNGGASWQPDISDLSYEVAALACPGPTTCYAAGYAGEVVKTTDGRTWRNPTPYTRQSLNAIACPGALTCLVVGRSGTVLTTADGGATWVRRQSGSSANLGSIACLDTRTCIASGGSVLLRTGDGGQTWQAQTVDGTMHLGSLACPSPAACFATGTITQDAKSPPTAAMLRSTDGGRAWTAYPLARTDGMESYVQSVACAGPKRCVAAGGVTPCNDVLLQRSATATLHPKQAAGCTPRGWLFGTTDGGLHWQRELDITGGARMQGGGTLLSVDCASSGPCYAAGYGIWASNTAGTTWAVTAPERFAGGQWTVVHSLSCPGSSTCWGLASDGNDWAGLPILTTDGGRSWHLVAQHVPVPGQENAAGLLTLSCPSASRCLAAGLGGLVMAYGG